MAADRPRLVITGASGLIGGILWRGLSDSYELRGVDREGDGGRILAADLAEAGAARRAFQEIGPFELLVHLAADRRVEAPWSSVLKNNIQGTYHAYDAAAEHGVRRVVFASSNHVAGMVEREGNLDEVARPSDPPRPDSLYGVSKLFGEGLARYYAERHGLESICLRIGSVLEHDDPAGSERFKRTWLSHRDLVHLVERSLKAAVPFGVYYGVSANRDRFWSIEEAQRDLGYRPRDDAARLVDETAP